jgi:hypothetical protein
MPKLPQDTGFRVTSTYLIQGKYVQEWHYRGRTLLSEHRITLKKQVSLKNKQVNELKF